MIQRKAVLILAAGPSRLADLVRIDMRTHPWSKQPRRFLINAVVSATTGELPMYSLAKGLTSLAALAFVLAVATNFRGGILGVTPEGFSRAANNLALLAIALVVVFGERALGSRSATLP